MAPAREALEPALRELDFQPLAVPLYRNVDATTVQGPDEVCDGLVRQVDAPVLWSEIVRRMLADGYDTFVEVGTGKVLSGLVKRINREATCYPAGTVEEIERVIADLVGLIDKRRPGHAEWQTRGFPLWFESPAEAIETEIQSGGRHGRI